jgi:hypothetical protein
MGFVRLGQPAVWLPLLLNLRLKKPASVVFNLAKPIPCRSRIVRSQGVLVQTLHLLDDAAVDVFVVLLKSAQALGQGRLGGLESRAEFRSTRS